MCAHVCVPIVVMRVSAPVSLNVRYQTLDLNPASHTQAAGSLGVVFYTG